MEHLDALYKAHWDEVTRKCEECGQAALARRADVLSERIFELHKLVLDTPHKTQAGANIKLRVVKYYFHRAWKDPTNDLDYDKLVLRRVVDQLMGEAEDAALAGVS